MRPFRYKCRKSISKEVNMSKAVNMKKLLLCFFAAVFAICLSAGLMTGCSSNESKSSSEAPEYLGEDGKFVVGFDEPSSLSVIRTTTANTPASTWSSPRPLLKRTAGRSNSLRSIGTPRMLRSIPVRSTSSGMASPSKAARTPMSHRSVLPERPGHSCS